MNLFPFLYMAVRGLPLSWPFVLRRLFGGRKNREYLPIFFINDMENNDDSLYISCSNKYRLEEYWNEKLDYIY